MSLNQLAAMMELCARFAEFLGIAAFIVVPLCLFYDLPRWLESIENGRRNTKDQ